LVDARELLHFVIALIPGNAATKGVQWHEVHELREKEFAGVHDSNPPDESQGDAQIGNKFSSR
jgi:hypothetical protein